jgi:site-specific DNA-methyltransferase (adenine-specific)
MIEPNNIYLGDCLELMKQMPDKSVDFAFADPPYGIGKAYWDKKYPSGFEQELLRISMGVGITCGQENIGTCINNLGDEYKGIVSAWNMNGMTYNKIGFGNWIPTIIAGKIKRGQDFFKFSIKEKKPNHPSPKPIEYMIKLIERFTDINDIVFDPFLGSGTTAVACIKTNRRYIGIEIDPTYIEIAKKRIELEKQQMKLELV